MPWYLRRGRFTSPLMILWAVLGYGMLIFSISAGVELFAAMFALVVGPYAHSYAVVLIEKRTFRHALGAKQAWAVRFGDTIALPVAMVGLALSWPTLGHSMFQDGPWWMLNCLAIGLVVGAVFHTFDGSAYIKAGRVAALGSPSKQVHDYVTYPALFGALLYGGLPLVVDSVRASNYGAGFWMFTLGIVAWLGLCIRDMVAGLDITALHPIDHPWLE